MSDEKVWAITTGVCVVSFALMLSWLSYLGHERRMAEMPCPAPSVITE